MNTSNDLYGYVTFYDRKRHELYAHSLYAAKQAAVAYFKPPKSRQHMVSVVLAELPNGMPTIHAADF